MRARRPSPATIIACVALAVALGGTATAARTLITSKDLAPGAVKAGNIAPGAVKARHLAKGAVTKPKLALGIQVPGTPGAQGPQGAQGAQGPQGPQGPAGGFTPANISLVSGPVATYPDTFPGGTVPQSNATCPVGAVAIAGFWQIDGSYYAEPAPFINSFRQTSDPRTWSVSLQAAMAYTGDISYHAVAVCATPS
jgi:hypothetical protein